MREGKTGPTLPSKVSKDFRNIEGATTSKNELASKAISIEDYCSANSLELSAVWSRIHRGELSAKIVDHKVFINQIPTHKIPETEEALLQTPAALLETGTKPQSFEQQQPSADKRAFLDYLASVKEENQQVLSLTQQVLNQMQHMNSKVENLQAEVLELKTQENQRLHQELNHKEQETKAIRQEMEDLKLLLKTFESDLNI